MNKSSPWMGGQPKQTFRSFYVTWTLRPPCPYRKRVYFSVVQVSRRKHQYWTILQIQDFRCQCFLNLVFQHKPHRAVLAPIKSTARQWYSSLMITGFRQKDQYNECLAALYMLKYGPNIFQFFFNWWKRKRKYFIKMFVLILLTLLKTVILSTRVRSLKFRVLPWQWKAKTTNFRWLTKSNII